MTVESYAIAQLHKPTKSDRNSPKPSKPNAIAPHKNPSNLMRSHFPKTLQHQMRSHLTKPFKTKRDRTSQNLFKPNAIAPHKTLQTKCDRTLQKHYKPNAIAPHKTLQTKCDRTSQNPSN
jgi:hypothetical protein